MLKASEEQFLEGIGPPPLLVPKKVIEAGSLLTSPDIGSGTLFDEGPDAIVRRRDISSLQGLIGEVYLCRREIGDVFHVERLAQSRKSGTSANANRVMNRLSSQAKIQLILDSTR